MESSFIKEKAVKKTGKIIQVSIIVVLVILVVFTYFVTYADSILKSSTELISSTGAMDEIIEGDIYRQEIVCEENNLENIKIALATFKRVNKSHLLVDLLEGRDIIKSWTVDCSLLRDGDYYTFHLDKKIANSRGKKYIIQIQSDARVGNGVTFLTNDDDNAEGLSVNGGRCKKTLCYQLDFKQEYKVLWEGVNGFHINMLILLIIVCFIATFLIFKFKTENIFLIIWVLLGLMYMFTNPVFNVPDEGNHFCRAFEISSGYMISEYDAENERAGRELPLDVDIYKLKESWKDFSVNKDMVISENKVFQNFANTALYSPVSYIPQAIGIFLGRQISANIVVIAYFGRIFNWIWIGFLLYLSIKVAPLGKEMLVLIALMPMNVHEAVSLAPDGMVVALSMFMVAYTMYLCRQEAEKLKIKQIIVLYVVAIYISLLKIVYLPFCLVYFLIPSERFGDKKYKIFHAIGLAVLAIGVNLVWLKICNRFLITTGTDATVQFQYILKEPLNYLVTIFRTVYDSAESWVLQMMGNSLGHLNIQVSPILILVYFSMIIRKYKFNGKITSGVIIGNIFQRIIFGAIVCFTLLLIFTSLYMQWTPVYKSTIDGIQGRYFIALLFPLYFIFDNANDVNAEKLSAPVVAIAMGVNACACISLLMANL